MLMLPGAARVAVIGGAMIGGASGGVRGACTQWTYPFGIGQAGIATSPKWITRWDPDGTGPLGEHLVMGGSFQFANSLTVNRVALWNGQAWGGIGNGFNSTVYAITAHDPDGAGPLSEWLIAGGNFTSSGAMPMAGCAKWDGTSWQAFGDFDTGVPLCFHHWDPDGGGPEPSSLVVGGAFGAIDGWQTRNIAILTEAGWRNLGQGTNDTVLSIRSWDPDGPGPEGTKLVACGLFTQAGGMTASRVATWNGTSWEPFGDLAFNNPASDVAVFDIDGPGPGPERLVMGGGFTLYGGQSRQRIVWWDGATWQLLGGGVSDTVQALQVWDQDGPGPQPPKLVVAGQFTMAGGVPASRIATWDGTSWAPIGTGLNQNVERLTLFDPDGPGAHVAQLLISGIFTSANSQPASFLAYYGTIDAPAVAAQPVNFLTCPGGGGQLAAQAGMGIVGVSYRWEVESAYGSGVYVDVTDGASMAGSVFAGAATPQLSVTNAQGDAAGRYRCRVSNTCGQNFSAPALLAVTSSCVAGDANGDGMVNSADLSVLLGGFGTIGLPGANADFNGDGLVNAADLSVLLSNFGS